MEVGDEYDFDLVHGHDWLVAGAGDHLAKRFRCPFVVTIHATEFGRHQGWVDKHPQSHIHGVERWMANRADRVITCSAYMRDHVADIYGLDEGDVTVIPNGIDPSELTPVDDLDALRARFAEPDQQLILLVGRLVYEKGFQLALEAMPGLVERLGNVRFLVAGSGTAEADLRRQASELGLDDHGTFMGWIGDDVLHSLYRVADLTVVPSLYEPFGLVALEAMASGCPCIVADTGGLREIVPADDRVGLRFNGGDPEHLATMVERLLTDDALRERLVAEASEHVLSFDWADVAEQTAELYGGRGAAAHALRLARQPRCATGTPVGRSSGRLGLRPLGCAGGLVGDAWQPAEPARQVPVPVAEQLHRRRQQHAADDRGVDQDRRRQAHAHLLELDRRQRGEDREHRDHHRGRAGHHAGGGLDAAGDRLVGGHAASRTPRGPG